MKLKTPLALSLSVAFATGALAASEIVIATVNNGHMIEMQKLTPHFEKANPGIKVKWVTLEEGTLRQRVTTDIATKGGQFDVMTIGMYETPIWGKKGWLKELKADAAYDIDDLLPAMRNGLSLYPGRSIEDFAQAALAAGTPLVVVTRGGQGAVAFHAAGCVAAEPVSVVVIDTVGAGDTFQAALLTWLAEQDALTAAGIASLDPPAMAAALRFATRAAAITCGRRGADLPRRGELA